MLDNNIPNLNVSTLIISIFSSGVVSAIVAHFLGKRRDKEIEEIKVSLAQGSYIGRSQFDLEVGAYKELWATISSLRLHVRSLLMSDALRIADVDGQEDRAWHLEAFPSLLKQFSDAHNAALLACDKFAPFYPPAIHRATYSISACDVRLLNFLGGSSIPQFSNEWYDALRPYIDGVLSVTDDIEEALRQRLNNLRVGP